MKPNIGHDVLTTLGVGKIVRISGNSVTVSAEGWVEFLHKDNLEKKWDDTALQFDAREIYKGFAK